MVGVFLAQDGLQRVNAPVNAERSVEYGYSSVGLRSIIVVAFVLKHGNIAQNSKAMGKAARNEELAVVVLRQFNGHMLPECGRAAADVDGYIEHSASHTAHQFGLSKGRTLEMQTAHYSTRGTTFIVLHKVHRSHLPLKFALRITLEKISARICKNTGFYDYYPGDGRFLHFNISRGF